MKLDYYYNKFLLLLHLITELEFIRRTRKYSSAYKLIYRSGLFDEKFYFNKYIDVQNSGISPIEHYITHGFKEGRSISDNIDYPSLFDFDTLGTKFNFFNRNKKHDVSSACHERKIDIFFEKNNSKQRKILLFSHELTCTGAPRALLNMAKTLKKLGFEPVVLSPCYGDLESELRENSIEYYIEPLLLEKLLFQEDTIRKFFQTFEIICFNTLISLRYFHYIRSKNKKIAWIHEGKIDFSRENARYDLEEVFSKCEKIYLVSDYIKQFVAPFVDAHKIEILSPFIKTPSLENKLQSHKFTFILVGYYIKVKGHNRFLEAVQSLPKEMYKSCEFKFVGEIGKSSYSKKIYKQAKKLGITQYGKLSYEDTLKEINLSDVLVCPSINESLSLVSIEAMMLEKTILCSKDTGISAFIENGKNGYIFSPNTDTLADKLITIYNNRQNLSKIGKEASKTSFENFSNIKFMERVKSIFNQTNHCLLIRNT